MSTEIAAKSPELEEPTAAHHDSEEYESAEEVEEASYEEEVEEVEVEVEEEVEDEEEATDKEPEKEKEVDEDRKNPQFIPKKGYFYEHDDRAVGEEEPLEEEKPITVEKPKPKAVAREPDRWAHDLFDEEEQAPKTRTELSGRYGYDIRSEDQAPRARRRRRYGRGPTKYTRKWEEEEAYQKPRGGGGGQRGRGGRGSRGGATQSARTEFDEEFPELGPSQHHKPASAAADDESKGSRKENYYQAQSRGDGERGGSRRGGAGSTRGRGHDSHDRERQDEPSARGRGGGRGWGRRNEFSNRNRYPDRRGSSETDYATAAAPDGRKEQKTEKPKEHYYQKEVTKPEEAKKVGEKIAPNQNFANTSNANSAAKKSTSRIPPPFTNTEYKGSESLTAAKPQQNVNERMASTRSEQVEPNYNDNLGTVESRDAYQRDGDDQDRRANRGYPPDRRAHVPPRLQQQQQQPMDSAPKPKRFSTQRQRQNVDPTKGLTSVTATGVVSGTGPAPVSAMSGYPQASGYYDTAVPTTYEARAYPGTGPSVAVSGSGHGPTVTPSLWVPHSSPYVTAPYPSPPTGPQVPQPPYQDPTYMPTQQGGPPIFAPPPHPQFIQDPTIINYVPPVPPPNYGPSFHASGFQGYPQVAPPPPPELYHGGVTYYSTQNQIPRPHMSAMNKRPKQVLQLVEPPEKKDVGRYPGGGVGQHQYEMDFGGQYHEGTPGSGRPETEGAQHPPTVPTTGATATKKTDSELADQLETMKLQPETERVKKSPSPAPLDLGEKSWSEQMADITPVNSPTDTQGPDRISSDKSNESNEESKTEKIESNNEDSKQTKAAPEEASSSPK